MLAACKHQVVKHRGIAQAAQLQCDRQGAEGWRCGVPSTHKAAQGHSPPQGQSPCPITTQGLRGRRCPAGTVYLHLRQGQPCCCVCGCACVCACWKHGECFNCQTAGLLDRTGHSCACTHTRGRCMWCGMDVREHLSAHSLLIVSKMPLKVPPARFCTLLDSPVCSQVH